MNTEDEHNYKGYPMEIVQNTHTKQWRVFSRNKFLSEGQTRDESIIKAEQCVEDRINPTQ